MTEKYKRNKSIKSQQKLIQYLSEKKSLEKAAEGSMKKRNDLINRVDAKLKHAKFIPS